MSNTINLTINGISVTGNDTQTILDVAKLVGVEIPTLCHDERVKPYGSCGICVVEIEGNPRLIRSCSTLAADGMAVHTESERITRSRKTTLELLLSDHTGDCRPPCQTACPAGTDCQGYVGLCANGEDEEAFRLVADKIPLPSSIGRVCPHPCEEACRRKLVEDSVSIAGIKAFLGDMFIDKTLFSAPDVHTNKSVAIIGGGPGGLTAAYYLRQKGHEVTVFDAMPEMGGMLRYGIPEYRLPKHILRKEIENIQRTGIEYKNNMRLGTDITLDELSKNYDAVLLAIGAWTSSKLRCPGEDLDGVIGAIDFLRDIPADLYGQTVAITGGSNTAMDACRTAIRLGADKVYLIYRRTRAEMPAEEIEISEAEEEGVEFLFLNNPIEIIGQNGTVNGIVLQKMSLGEPDSSGRRSPIPIEGEIETLAIDKMIIAIGQSVNPHGLSDIELTKYSTIIADPNYFTTNIDGVFAAGDATNRGAGIAIEAIAEAKKAAVSIDAYLNGTKLQKIGNVLVKQEKTEADFIKTPRLNRIKMRHLNPNERKDNFKEVNLGYDREELLAEANRCMECGCHDYFECKLIKLVNNYNAEQEKFMGESHINTTKFDPYANHPFLNRNLEKCILCGLCVRVCEEVVGACALGLVNRGFDTAIKPALDKPLIETDCVACGQCVTLCPTGALTETRSMAKQVPTDERISCTTCSYCANACSIRVHTVGDTIVRVTPDDSADSKAVLCAVGRFGQNVLHTLPRIKDIPDYHLQFIDANTVILVSDALYNEEISIIKTAVDKGYTVRYVDYAKNTSNENNFIEPAARNINHKGLVDSGISPIELSIIDDIKEGRIKTIISVGTEVNFDIHEDTKLIMFSAYKTPATDQSYLTIPLGTWLEEGGSFTNSSGDIIKNDSVWRTKTGASNVQIIENFISSLPTVEPLNFALSEIYCSDDRSLHYPRKVIEAFIANMKSKI